MPSIEKSAAASSWAAADDLTSIQGIGEARAKQLEAAGVTTFADLMVLDPDERDKLADTLKMGERGTAQIREWQEQAEKLYAKMHPEGAGASLAPDEDAEPEPAPAPEPEPEDDEVEQTTISLDPRDARIRQLEAELAEMRAQRPSPVTRRREGYRRRLDRTKPYADILGSFGGARWSQRDEDKKTVYFNHAGIEMLTDAKGNIIEDEVPEDAKVEPPVKITPQTLSLRNWIDGRVEASDAIVFQAVKERYGKRFTKRKDVQKYLHETLRGAR